jgi:glycine/sarcosine N-methyltransferase
MVPVPNFYDLLAQYYDDVFPYEETIAGFLRTELAGDERVLDVACGTGTYSLALAEDGRDVTGVDLSESLLRIAEEKAKSGKPGSTAASGGHRGELRFVVGDMLDLEQAAGSGYGALYCIGNSIVHLSGEAEIERALAGFHRALAPGGRLILQIINFDRIKLKSVRELPSLEGRGARLVRRYEPADEDGVFFDTSLEVFNGPGKGSHQSRVRLFAARAETLVELVRRAGFGAVRLYGSYGREAWDAASSFLTIVSAEKEKA